MRYNGSSAPEEKFKLDKLRMEYLSSKPTIGSNPLTSENKIMKKIRLIKACASENPAYPTPNADDFIPGMDHGNVSLPEGYTIEGMLEHTIEVGKSIVIARTHRNGIAADGLTETSPVAAINQLDDNKLQVETANSVYTLEYLNIQ